MSDETKNERSRWFGRSKPPQPKPTEEDLRMNYLEGRIVELEAAVALLIKRLEMAERDIALGHIRARVDINRIAL